MNGLQIFNYEQNQIRVIERNGEPWWVLKDVCDALGLSNPTIVAQRLDEDEVTKFDLGGLSGESNIVNEPGLYNVILRSDKPEAKKFKRWITHEVLPSIRKTGAYSAKKTKVDQTVPLMRVHLQAAALISKLWNAAGIKPEYQAMALQDKFPDLIPKLPAIAMQQTKVTYDKGAIATKLGIYSRSDNPHAHAVGAIIRQLDISAEEQVQVPYCNNGHDGFDIQYTESAVAKVRAWLESHNWPTMIGLNGKNFAINYRSV